jgi:hypothetical protein
MEHGRIDRFTLATIRRVLRALDASVSLDLRWHGRGDLDRLLDADHARLVTAGRGGTPGVCLSARFHSGRLRRAGQQRVRVRQAVASVAKLETPPVERPIRA